MIRDTYRLEQEARSILADSHPLTHEELTDRLGCEWDMSQRVIRALRSRGEVVITIDRRYELSGGRFE